MLSEKRVITPRRTIEQIKHCVEDALSAFINNEDARCVFDDLDQARKLIDIVIKDTIFPMAKGAGRQRGRDEEGAR